MMSKGRLRIILSLFVFVLVIMPSKWAAGQQTFPIKAIDLVVPFGPGGGNDQWARILSSVSEETLGVPLRVRNMPGGGGIKGCRYALKAKPDGYTLLTIGIEALLTRLILQKDEVGFSLDDIQGAVTFSAYVPALGVDPKAPYTTAKDFFQYARENPGKFTFGTSGSSSIFTFVGGLVGDVSGVTLTNVPFDGTGEAITAALGGHTGGVICSQDQLIELHKAGRLRVLFTTGEKRTKELPDVPTLKEVGYDLEFENHRSVYAPKGVPEERLRVLEKGFQNLVKHKSFVRLARYLGEDVIYLSAEQTNALIRRQYDLLQRGIKKVREGK